MWAEIHIFLNTVYSFTCFLFLFTQLCFIHSRQGCELCLKTLKLSDQTKLETEDSRYHLIGTDLFLHQTAKKIKSSHLPLCALMMTNLKHVGAKPYLFIFFLFDSIFINSLQSGVLWYFSGYDLLVTKKSKGAAFFYFHFLLLCVLV